MKMLLLGLVAMVLLATSAGCASSSLPKNMVVPPATSQAPGTSDLRHSYGLDNPVIPQIGGSKGPAPAAPTAVPPVTPAPPSFSSQNEAESNSSVSWGNITNPQSPLNGDRMVVRTGNMQVVVDDISAAMDNISKIAANYGGYVVSSQRGKDGERNVGSISIRIQAASYDNAMKDLRVLAKSVTSESTSSQDVTEEYVDLDSKVKNLEATEAQLLKIMEGATKTEDVLSIQRELTNVRGDIEQAKGRMQFLERTSATSLIQIQLEEAVLALKFSADKASVGTGEEIHFKSEVIGGFPPYSYQWDFGDGNTSNEISPSHSYKNPGIYYVSLKVSDDKGYTNTLARNEYIHVIGSWKPASVAASAWNGFTAFGRVFVNILIWLGIFSPVWIVIGGIIGYGVWRKRRKKV